MFELLRYTFLKEDAALTKNLWLSRQDICQVLASSCNLPFRQPSFYQTQLAQLQQPALRIKFSLSLFSPYCQSHLTFLISKCKNGPKTQVLDVFPIYTNYLSDIIQSHNSNTIYILTATKCMSPGKYPKTYATAYSTS